MGLGASPRQGRVHLVTILGCVRLVVRTGGGPGPHHVRPAKCAKTLNYGQCVIDNSMIKGANQQITLCFLQDLQSE
eukprot:5224758-Prymnesium_polylepis.1